MTNFRKLLLPLLLCAVVMNAVMVGVPVVLFYKQEHRSARRANQATERVRRAAYRICSRDNGERAFALALTKNGKNYAFARKTLPILDCSPNLFGSPSTRLSTTGQDSFVKYEAATGDTPFTCNGRWLPGTSVYSGRTGVNSVTNKCEAVLKHGNVD